MVGTMLGRMLGAARLNVDTYEEVEKDGGATIQALLVVIIVTIASVAGELLGGADIDVVRALAVGVIRGVLSWALWALVTWVIGSTILKTEDDRSRLGAAGARHGVCTDPRDSEPVQLHTGRRMAHLIGDICLDVCGHDDCRATESGLYLDIAGVLCDPDRLHPGGHHERHCVRADGRRHRNTVVLDSLSAVR